MLADLFDGSIKLNLLASDAFEPGFHKFLVHVDRSHRPKHLARLARLDGNGEMRLGDLGSLDASVLQILGFAFRAADFQSLDLLAIRSSNGCDFLGRR